MSGALGNQKKSQSQIHPMALMQDSTAEKSSITTIPTLAEKVLLPHIKYSATPGNSVVPAGGSVMHQIISSGSFNSFSKGAEPQKKPPESTKHKIRVMPRGSQPYQYPPKSESLKSIAPLAPSLKSPNIKVFNSVNFVSALDDAYTVQTKQFGIKDTSLERNESNAPSPFYAPTPRFIDVPNVGSSPHTPMKSTAAKHRKQRQTEVFEQIAAKGFHSARHSQNKISEGSANSTQTAVANPAPRIGAVAKSAFFRTMVERSVDQSPRAEPNTVRIGSREGSTKMSSVKSGIQLKVISSLVERQRQQAGGPATSFPLLRDSESSRVDPPRIPGVSFMTANPPTLTDLGSCTPSKEVKLRGPAESLPKNLATTLSRFKVMPANKRNWGLMSENRSTILHKVDAQLLGQTAN